MYFTSLTERVYNEIFSTKYVTDKCCKRIIIDNTCLSIDGDFL